eukprot:1153841-Pelagomonas_calceolata.AAC.1
MFQWVRTSQDREDPHNLQRVFAKWMAENEKAMSFEQGHPSWHWYLQMIRVSTKWAPPPVCSCAATRKDDFSCSHTS